MYFVLEILDKFFWHEFSNELNKLTVMRTAGLEIENQYLLLEIEYEDCRDETFPLHKTIDCYLSKLFNECEFPSYFSGKWRSNING